MAITSSEILINHPAHLFIGTAHAVNTHVVSLIQRYLCPHNGCTYCGICQGIYNHTHHQLMWLESEGNYTREMMQPILNTMALQQNTAEHFFIVIPYAERLQQASANALLKSLEEPPYGYHFILMTAQSRLIIATIRSRCIVHDIPQQQAVTLCENKLIAHFTGVTYQNPSTFLALIDQLNLSDQESYDYLDTIIGIIRVQLEKALVSQSQKTVQQVHLLLDIFIQASLLPPQSGSSKIFWKNLYLKTDKFLCIPNI